MLWGVLSCSLLLLAAPVEAAPARFGPRAGSGFSAAPDVYGRVSRRPLRRQQEPGSQPLDPTAASFDYRLDSASAPAAFASYDADPEFVEQGDTEPTADCDCGDSACCGDCVEPGCGCEDGCEPGCGCADLREAGCGCDDVCAGHCDCQPTCRGGGGCFGTFADRFGGGGTAWHVGFEWTLVKPRFSENVALTTMEGNAGNSSSGFSDSEFDYDLQLTPRVWIEAQIADRWSWRVSYWQFDHAPAAVSGSPNANGFGEITHPDFGEVDISTSIPTDTLTAASHLNAYTIDVEALKQAQLDGWLLRVGGGVRYAAAEQHYLSRLRDVGNVLRGQIDFAHKIEGVGPTISLSARRPLAGRVELLCAARGSLLYGDGSSRLIAGEDLNFTTPSFTTTRLTNREDLLPIGEARVGVEWLSPPPRRGGFRWLLSTAMEGQAWGNAGNAASETADLGFFGFNVGAGFLR